MTLQRLNVYLATSLKVLLVIAVALAMLGCAQVRVFAPTYNAPIHITGAGGVTNFPGSAKTQNDAATGKALNDATAQIALLGSEEDKVYQHPYCPIFKRPDYLPVPGIPLDEINAVPESDTDRKLQIIINYTKNLRQWIITRREIQNVAYAKYMADCDAIQLDLERESKRR